MKKKKTKTFFSGIYLHLFKILVVFRSKFSPFIDQKFTSLHQKIDRLKVNSLKIEIKC